MRERLSNKVESRPSVEKLIGFLGGANRKPLCRTERKSSDGTCEREAGLRQRGAHSTLMHARWRGLSVHALEEGVLAGGIVAAAPERLAVGGALALDHLDGARRA